MLDHLATTVAAPALSLDGGQLLGSVGSGGIALALSTVLVAGIREPKPGGKTSKIRRKLTSDEAQWTGVAAGTCYMAAGSIWTAGEEISNAFANIFTNGAFGTAGLGAVSALLAAVMYFRELAPGRAAFTGILAAGVWAQAGGIWGVPEALVLMAAGALGAM